MKLLLGLESDPQAEFVAVDLALQIKTLFADCPYLCGFAVEDVGGLHGDAGPHETESGFVITHVSFGIPFSLDEARQTRALIASVVAELVAAQPEAYELLRDRTFARTLH
jgi:hypothetical protein